MEKTKISVIIPVYNVKPYLERCIESVRIQTYTNLEIIIIDDGSTDGSEKLCDEYALKDDRVLVFHQKNSGQAAARNLGIDHATGEWIAFLDSDDWIEPEMYEVLLHTALVNNVEISSCLSRNCTTFQETVVLKDDGEVSVLDLDRIIEGLYTQKVRFELWDKLWKSSLIGEIRLKKGQLGEEVYFDRVLFLRANKMAVINRTLHNYLVSRAGNTNSSFKIARLCIFEEFDTFIKELNEKSKEDLANIMNCLAMDYAINIFTRAVQSNQDSAVKDFLREKAREYYKISNNCRKRRLKSKIAAWLFNINPGIYLLAKKFKYNV